MENFLQFDNKQEYDKLCFTYLFGFIMVSISLGLNVFHNLTELQNYFLEMIVKHFLRNIFHDKTFFIFVY